MRNMTNSALIIHYQVLQNRCTFTGRIDDKRYFTESFEKKSKNHLKSTSKDGRTKSPITFKMIDSDTKISPMNLYYKTFFNCLTKRHRISLSYLKDKLIIIRYRPELFIHHHLKSVDGCTETVHCRLDFILKCKCLFLFCRELLNSYHNF